MWYDMRKKSVLKFFILFCDIMIYTMWQDEPII